MISTLILSLPTSNYHLKVARFTINTLLLLLCIDFAASPLINKASSVTFTRVGAVYSDAVKITVRYPQFNTTEDGIRVIYREADKTSPDAWKNGPIAWIEEANDWTSTVKLKGLWPSKAYEYRLASRNATLLDYPPHPIRFKTFPDPKLASSSHFKFITSSCVLPNFPYVPFRGRTIKGFDLLAEYLWPTQNITIEDAVETVEVPTSFLLFLGDFIYADVPVYFGDKQETYRRLYRRMYQSPSYRRIYEKLRKYSPFPRSAKLTAP